MLASIAGLFFHDKQQTADLGKAQAENAQLTDQLAAYQSQVVQLQIKLQQATAQAARATSEGNLSNQSAPAQAPYRSPLTTDHLQGSGYH